MHPNYEKIYNFVKVSAITSFSVMGGATWRRGGGLIKSATYGSFLKILKYAQERFKVLFS